MYAKLKRLECKIRKMDDDNDDDDRTQIRVSIRRFLIKKEPMKEAGLGIKHDYAPPPP